MVRTQGLPEGCAEHATASVHVDTSPGFTEKLVITVKGFRPGTPLVLFAIQKPNAPFGIGWYEGDVAIGAKGSVTETFVSRFNIETFATAVGQAQAPKTHPADGAKNPAFKPIHTYHLGIWFELGRGGGGERLPAEPDGVQRRPHGRPAGAEHRHLPGPERPAGEDRLGRTGRPHRHRGARRPTVPCRGAGLRVRRRGGRDRGARRRKPSPAAASATMAAINPERLDLNLLRVLEALLAERHVTRAAARLGLTQSAVSNALRRLRAAFGDELFQRTPAGMEPTALARELAGPVGAALDAVRAAAALNRPFDPATARDEVTMGVSDYAELVLGPPLIAELARTAPGLSLTLRHVDREVALDLLERDRAQLAVGTLPEPPAHMTRVVLLRDGFGVLVRQGHPAEGGLDLAAFLAWPHLLVSAVASRRAVDRALATIGERRRVAAVVAHHLAAGAVLRRSDLLCTLARRVALPLAEAFGLVLLPLPAEVALGAQSVSLVFHNRYAQHPAHRWLRRLVAETARRPDVT